MSVYERRGMSPYENGVQCGVVEWVKRDVLMWFSHTERIVCEKGVHG